jgi:hypothetical protein
MCRDRDDLPRRGAQATRHRLTCTPELVSTVLIFALTIPELVNQVRSLIAMEPGLRERLAEWFARSPVTANLADVRFQDNRKFVPDPDPHFIP